MQTEELANLVFEIISQRTEKQNIELKAASHGCPTKLFDSLSSFLHLLKQS